MSNTCDIFISYRREGGDFLGQLLYERLSNMGYSVFFDVESLRSGKFNEALYKYMDACTDAIILLPPNALDRCVNDEDWVRKEISYLMKKQKNIIPVMMRGFVFPNKLPNDMQDFDKYNGIVAQEASSFSWVIDQLINKFLKSVPHEKGSSETAPCLNMDQEITLMFEKKDSDSKADTTFTLGQKLYDIKAKNYYKQINSALNVCKNQWKNIKNKPISIKENCFVFPSISGFKIAIFQIDLFDDYYTLSRYFDFTKLEYPPVNLDQFSGKIFRYENSNIKDILLLIVMSCEEKGEILLICSELEDGLLILKNEIAVLKYKDIVYKNDNCNSLKYIINQNNTTPSRFEANFDPGVSLILDAETLNPIPREIVHENGKMKAYINIAPFNPYIILQLNLSGIDTTEITALSSYDIAYNYQYGKNGFPLDILKAVEYYQKDNSRESLYQISQIFKNNNIYNDDEEYKLYLQSAVEKNCSEAIAETIFNTYKDNGCKINSEIATKITDNANIQEALNIYSKYLINNSKYDDAFKCLEMAAAIGNSTSVNNLGYMYKNGYGHSVDYAKAKELFEKSIEMGSSVPYGHLAEMYEYGLGIKKDLKKAYEYYKIGAKLGNERCIKWIKNNSYD